MKKLLTLLLALTTAASLAACGAPETPAEPSEPAPSACLLYTSDAADDLLCVKLGGRPFTPNNTNEHQNTN